MLITGQFQIHRDPFHYPLSSPLQYPTSILNRVLQPQPTNLICNLAGILPAQEETLHMESDTAGHWAREWSVTNGTFMFHLQNKLLAASCLCIVPEHPFKINLGEKINTYLNHHQHVAPIPILVWLHLLCSYLFT